MKYKNKGAIDKKFVELRRKYRAEFAKMKEAGAIKGSFKNSTIKKLLDKREKGAIYRFKNRDRIIENQKKYRENVKKYRDFTAKVVTVFDGSAIEAYSGGKHGQDRAAINAFAAKNFVGVIIHTIEGDYGTEKKEYRYRTQGAFFSRLRKILSSLFDKSDGYRIFSTDVQKYLHYDKQSDTVYFIVKINEFPE